MGFLASLLCVHGQTSTSNLPVAVFFHGGSFAEGSDQGPFDMYDGSYYVAHRDVIIVTGVCVCVCVCE